MNHQHNTSHTIGFQVATLPARSREEVIDVYEQLRHDLSLTTAEILLEQVRDRVWFDHREPPPAALVRMLRGLEKAGAHLPFISINPISPEPSIRATSLDILKNAIDYASGCGLDYVVMHCRGWNHMVEKSELRGLWYETVQEIAEHAGKRNLTLSLENADYLFELKRIAAFVDALPADNVTITLDVGHAFFRLFRPRMRHYMLKAIDHYFPFMLFKNFYAHSSYGGVTKFIQHESDVINNLHLHDHNGTIDHLPPGKGRLDYTFLHHLSTRTSVVIEARFSTLEEVYESHKLVTERLNA